MKSKSLGDGPRTTTNLCMTLLGQLLLSGSQCCIVTWYYTVSIDISAMGGTEKCAILILNDTLLKSIENWALTSEL